jgi:acyl-coenzyme A synthetase/AMP-(fatty) acid ligase
MTIINSPFPDVEIPDVPVHDFIFGDLGDRAGRVAMIEGASGTSLTFGEMAGQVDSVAAALAERGILKGDVVGLFAPNSPAYAVVFHGILRAGATATTVNSLYTPDEIAHQLRDAGAKLLVTISPFLDRARPRSRRRACRSPRSSCSTAPRGTPACATCSRPRPRRRP